MSSHAFLSASSSHHWLNCPPSAKLNAEAESTTSEYARQGTDCHELCAYLVEQALGRDVQDPTENLDYYDSEMQNCAEEYRNFVLEQIKKSKGFCSDPQVMIEQRLDFSRWVPEGFGTGDCVIVADEELQIIDYKHGVGVLVDAVDNSQMILIDHELSLSEGSSSRPSTCSYEKISISFYTPQKTLILSVANSLFRTFLQFSQP